jgi:orotate phosphoribosyltransferase
MTAIDQTLLNKIRVLSVHEQGRIISRKGAAQNWLIDMRAALMQPDVLSSISSAFWNRHPNLDSIHIAGMETAAVPLVAGIVLEGQRRGKKVSGLIIRKERKKTGLGRLVEGTLEFSEAILIDDVINSGKSAEKARVALCQAGLTVRQVFVVIDYQANAGTRWRQRHALNVASIATLSDMGLSLRQRTNTKPKIHFEPEWHFAAPGAFPYYTVPKSAPLLVDESILFGSDNGDVWCLDTGSGKERWHFHIPDCGKKGIWSSPAHHDGRVYLGAYNGCFYCIAVDTGHVIWSQSLCEWIGSSPVIIPQHNLLVVGLEYARPRAKGSICALDLKTGERIWEKLLHEFQHGSGCYSHVHNMVVCGTNDHNVIALDPRSGKVHWTFITRRSVKYAPVIDEARGIVAFASFDGSIYVVNVKDGAKIAEFPTGSICYTTPLIHRSRLYCGSADKHLYVVDLDTMTLVGRLDMRARVFSSPRLVDGGILFGTSGGIVREIDDASLETRGQLVVPDCVSNAVAVNTTCDRIFVPTTMNEIYAFKRVVLS